MGMALRHWTVKNSILGSTRRSSNDTSSYPMNWLKTKVNRNRRPVLPLNLAQARASSVLRIEKILVNDFGKAFGRESKYPSNETCNI